MEIFEIGDLKFESFDFYFNDCIKVWKGYVW